MDRAKFLAAVEKADYAIIRVTMKEDGRQFGYKFDEIYPTDDLMTDEENTAVIFENEHFDAYTCYLRDIDKAVVSPGNPSVLMIDSKDASDTIELFSFTRIVF
jgi:hypothetical protein